MSSATGGKDSVPEQETALREDAEEGRSSDPVECPNCGRTFAGTYCPDCGEEVGRSLTMGDVVGDAFREVAEVGGGFQATLVGLTVRPGEVLQEYLSGARRKYMSPGRYLVAAVVLFLATAHGLTWLGLQKPLVDSAMIAEQSTDFMEELSYLTQSQWYTLVTVFINAGILGLLFRRIFGDRLDRAVEALAVGVFLIAHASMLSIGVRLLLVPSLFLWKGTAVDPMVPYLVGSLVSVLFPGVAAYRAFGTSWKSAAKGVMGAVWAYVETLGIGGISAFWYVFLTSRKLRDAIFAQNEVAPLLVAGVLTVVYLIPLFLHAAMELYYRLR